MFVKLTSSQLVKGKPEWKPVLVNVDFIINIIKSRQEGTNEEFTEIVLGNGGYLLAKESLEEIEELIFEIGRLYRPFPFGNGGD